MIVDNERIITTNDSIGRPFVQKTWPTLPMSMEPLQLLNQNNLTQETTNGSNKSGKLKKKIKKEKNTNSSETIPELMPLITSFDTNLHRTVIIERNKIFEKYQLSLKDRVESFKLYTSSLIEDSNAFCDFWKRSLLSLKPGLLL